eukprot:5461087-Amphidinium_carterae.1
MVVPQTWKFCEIGSLVTRGTHQFLHPILVGHSKNLELRGIVAPEEPLPEDTQESKPDEAIVEAEERSAADVQ